MSLPVRAAPHQAVPGLVIAVGGHAPAGGADGGAIAVDSNVVMDDLWMAAFVVKVNKSADFPVLEKLISRKIVHGGVEAHVPDMEGRHMFFEFMEGGKETDRVMAPGAGKP